MLYCQIQLSHISAFPTHGHYNHCSHRIKYHCLAMLHRPPPAPIPPVLPFYSAPWVLMVSSIIESTNSSWTSKHMLRIHIPTPLLPLSPPPTPCSPCYPNLHFSCCWPYCDSYHLLSLLLSPLPLTVPSPSHCPLSISLSPLIVNPFPPERPHPPLLGIIV